METQPIILRGSIRPTHLFKSLGRSAREQAVLESFDNELGVLMRVLRTLLLFPAVIGVIAALAFPSATGLIFGLIAIGLYFLVVTIRASDWG